MSVLIGVMPMSAIETCSAHNWRRPGFAQRVVITAVTASRLHPRGSLWKPISTTPPTHIRKMIATGSLPILRPKVRPEGAGFFDCLSLAPFGDFGVMAVLEHFGHALAAEFLGAS